MDENDKTNIVENPATVPNYVHQSDMARADMDYIDPYWDRRM